MRHSIQVTHIHQRRCWRAIGLRDADRLSAVLQYRVQRIYWRCIRALAWAGLRAMFDEAEGVDPTRSAGSQG